MSAANRWPVKYPWRQLPRAGSHPYIPPLRGDWLRSAPRGPNHGYLVDDGNEWVPHPPPSGSKEDFHWDVQHPDGRHTNVRPNGEVHHGADNFP
jgi:hypothetical protein